MSGCSMFYFALTIAALNIVRPWLELAGLPMTQSVEAYNIQADIWLATAFILYRLQKQSEAGK